MLISYEPSATSFPSPLFCIFWAFTTPAIQAQEWTPESALWSYRTALLAADGESAWEVIDKDTRSYYGQVRQDALNAARPELENCDFLTRLMIIRIRVEFPTARLETLTGKELFVHAVKQGWISRTTVEGLTKVTVLQNDGQRAAASIPEAPDTPLFHMIKEDDRWKLALSKVFTLANEALKQMAANSGMTENQFILEMLRRITKTDVNDSVFDGPIR